MKINEVYCLLIPLLLLTHSHSAISLDTIPRDAQRLIDCYPSFIQGFSHNHLIFRDATEMIWDDGIRNKSWQLLLDHADLKDMFNQTYKTGPLLIFPVTNVDPGRIRNNAFFEKMYGGSAKEVKKHLTAVIWCPKLVQQTIMVTKINNVDRQIEAVSAELDRHPELIKYLEAIGGTFAWRNIAGTNRHSNHSYGMTIDINTRYSDYWRWSCKCSSENSTFKYQNRIPQTIVDIFERHGFIWGGKWYHYDTMHFEYRPELFSK